MHPGPDPMGAPSGFASRRPNAPSLPTFELPPPPSQQKYNSYAVSASQSSQTPGSLASVGNLLTPPSTIGGDGISPSSAIQTSAASSGAPAYTPNGSYAWSPPTHATYSFSQQGSHQQQHQPYQHHHQQQQQHHQQQQHQQQQNVQQHPQRHTYSPLPSGNRVSQPPPSEGQMSTSSYESSLPSYPSSMSMPAASTLATMAPPHHQQQSQHGHMMSVQTPASSSGQHPSPAHSQEPFNRPLPTPQYYAQQPPNTPQHSHYPYSTGPSPPQAAPLSAGGAMGGRTQMSPSTVGPAPLSAPAVQTSHYTQRPPFNSSAYQPHNTHGPVLSNLNNPGGPPMLMGGLPQGLVGGFNSGHAANMQAIYNSNSHQTHAPPHNDRPFKCDQCPQSFNRNHDLKRHKRIHLAVKPFPCTHCDKSFSRKDALKRHILVKGCGKNDRTTDGDCKQEGSQSPVPKSDSHDVKPIMAP
ncbi:hypothetical protein FKW77_010466 [Venturia effusa]|uniref:C2H2-type domain-containing protein n=1 Tax=Venturia effusa TaxID=50376 RepID=A0A517L4J1_9PEZI|nr:hypothetical protein FKW77_010466 [Venturia effusa]